MFAAWGLRPEVEAHQLPGEPRALLWQRALGRGLWVSPTPEPTPGLKAQLLTHHLIGPAPGLLSLVPWPSRWALTLPERPAIYHPLPLLRGPDGFPFRAMALSPQELAAWRLMNGARRLGEVCSRSGLSLDDTLSLLLRLTDVSVQALQLRPGPARAQEPALDRLVSPPRPANLREEHHRGAEGETTLRRFHEEIHDAPTHFDEGETTFAHAFERPHPALGGRPFGAALIDALAQRQPLRSGLDVLEIGPGSGAVCEAALSRLIQCDAAPRCYTRLDLSPELLRAQAARCPTTQSLQGSAEAIPLPDAHVDLVLSNEVLADLTAAADPGGFEVTPLDGQAWYNVGAFRLVRELARVLRPGGLAYLSEFGAPDELPTETTQLDHPEVSVNFSQVAEVAAAAGLTVEILPLGALLGVDLDARWLSRASFEGLRCLFREYKLLLSARAYTPQTLWLPEPVEGQRFVSLREDGPAPVITRLWALVLRKPQVGPEVSLVEP
ncbi:class I SAM-dependent methyltransferase [Myxococcota bacterium]|nr:class I SAM-dependent methyltransferase [Myxococcota bacterium]